MRLMYFNILITFCGDICNFGTIFGENSTLIQLFKALLQVRIFRLIGFMFIAYKRFTDMGEICPAQGYGRAV